MSADLLNGLFEVMGGLFILNHCRVLHQAKAVSGVSIISTVFFNVWGVWNLYYYPSLDQFWSTLGGVLIVLANTLYVGMLIYYSKYYEPKRKLKAEFTVETFEELCERHGMNETTDSELIENCMKWVNDNGKGIDNE